MATFTYHERIENRFRRYLRPQFDFLQSISHEAILIRILLGTCRITNVFSTQSYDQFTNYSILGRDVNSPISTKPITECLEPDFRLADLCSYLDKNKHVNSTYFLHLLEEISSYYFKKARGAHTTGFIHLYRTLEYISYSFPLVYASLSRDYYGSFNTFKNYFDKTKSELNFFNVFTENLLDTSLQESPLTFNFNTLSALINQRHFQIIKNILTADNIVGEVANVSITTQYKHVLKLSIDLRNRYFHFAIGGQRNITPTEIIENDVFFEIINEELLNWIAVIYFNILKSAVEKN